MWKERIIEHIVEYGEFFVFLAVDSWSSKCAIFCLWIWIITITIPNLLFIWEIEMCVRSMNGWLYFVYSGSLNGMAHCSPVPCRPTSKVLTRKERKTKANIFVIKLIRFTNKYKFERCYSEIIDEASHLSECRRGCFNGVVGAALLSVVFLFR